jgi:hypothetical protein
MYITSHPDEPPGDDAASWSTLAPTTLPDPHLPLGIPSIAVGAQSSCSKPVPQGAQEPLGTPSTG